MKTTEIVLGIVGVALVLWLIFYPIKKQPAVTELNDLETYSCEEGGGTPISFKYPKYKRADVFNFEVYLEPTPSGCVIVFDDGQNPSTENAPQIAVWEDFEVMKLPLSVVAPLNPAGIQYVINYEQGESGAISQVDFYLDNSRVSLRPYNFSRDEQTTAYLHDFFKAVLDSFRAIQLNLSFSVGGSITGPTFTVDVTDADVVYGEHDRKGDLIKEIKKQLSPSDLDNLLQTLSDTDMLNLESQDFVADPMVPDEGIYNVHLTLKGMTNSVRCATYNASLDTTPTTQKCQTQMAKLVEVFNKMLGVNIY